MQVHTKLDILDCRRKLIRAYKTLKLTGMTTRKDIEAFILKTYECVKLPFDIEIRDQYDGFVTLDDNYIDDYNPFNPNATVTTGVQPTNSATPTLILQVILFNYTYNSTIEQESVNTVEGIQQNEHTQQIDQVVSTSKSQTHCTISFPNNSKMAFIDDFNVNSEQRDQYISDAINVDTGDIVGKLSMIQAPKTSKQKYGSRLPRFKNSPQTNSLPGNTNSVYNIDLNDASVLQQMNTNGDILNNDPSLYDAADCNTNCPFCGTPGYDIICCYCGEFS
ncbi:unnamed protein product [Rotaria sp. Silwood1]|nr:unnamed protein product [Rotaria sp. Silwood1]CAF1359547.1 unnamed protein product [Rotaria sp. Silwood1]CAF3505118.1 unnamed protein product [Rotaria sp. Silwood1]CAF4783505.1 unnamed protein product [Rotaria sp. Silwood1]